MRVAQIQSDYSIAPADALVPALPEGGALLQLTACGLCGSDLEKFVHQKALPSSVLGHEVVGVIEQLSESHSSDFKVGDRIVTAHHTPCGQCHYCRFDSQSMCRTFKTSNLTPGGFAQTIAMTGEHLKQTAFKIPDGITDAAASCVEPLACTLRAIDRLGLQSGQSVLVIGLGFIGLMAAQVFRLRGIKVFGLDLSEERLSMALTNHWADAAFAPNEADELTRALESRTELGKVDSVFLTVVNEHTLAEATRRVRDGGKWLLFASAPPTASIDPSVLYYQEISVITSYSPSVEHLAQAAALIFEEKVNVDPLVTHRFSLERIADAMALYRSGQAIKVMVTP